MQLQLLLVHDDGEAGRQAGRLISNMRTRGFSPALKLLVLTRRTPGAFDGVSDSHGGRDGYDYAGVGGLRMRDGHGVPRAESEERGWWLRWRVYG